MDLLRYLSAAVMSFLVAHGYWALFLLLLIEEAGVWLPLPGDIFVMYGGYQAYLGNLNPFGVLAAGIGGSFFGSMILYFIALKGGNRLLHRYGRYIHLHPERVDKMEERFRKYGIWAIVAARMIPGLRIATTVMAGVFGVPLRTFAPASFFGICIWAGTYFTLGIVLGESYMLLYEALGSYFKVFAIVVIVIVVTAIVGVLLWRRFRGPPRNPLRLLPEREQSDGG